MASSFANFAKTILLPLSIAFLIYFLLFHGLIPLYRRHRARYSNYTPLIPSSLTTTLSTYTPSFLSNLTSHFTSRVQNSIFLSLLLPSTWSARGRYDANGNFTWRTPFEASRHGVNPFLPRASHEEDDVVDLFDDEEGEGMVGFDVEAGRREREAVARLHPEADTRQTMVDSGRRLSRELEEGFRDDSDNEENDGRERQAISHTQS